jgi:hypothetical protein
MDMKKMFQALALRMALAMGPTGRTSYEEARKDEIYAPGDRDTRPAPKPPSK